MNRVRIGILLMAVAILGSVGVAVTAALGASLGQLAALIIAVELLFWGGTLLLGYSTYKVARAKGLRRVPGELWRMFRQPSSVNQDRHTMP